MTASLNANYKPDLMEDADRDAIMSAMEKLYHSEHLEQVWPSVFDVCRAGQTLPNVTDVDIIVKPLDRIGAPAGASGAKVFVAYFALRNAAPVDCPLPSPPLVVKVGPLRKLQLERDVVAKWPTLSLDVQARFALPIELDSSDPERSVLIAPFRSSYKPDSSGMGHEVGLNDLWGVLHKPEELNASLNFDSTRASRYVEHALDSIDYVHRNNKAKYRRESSTYKASYDWYLRDTFKVPDGKGYILESLFGSDSLVKAFGREWINPIHVVKSIIESNLDFEGTFGPVHGDLHPKNIVVGENDAVRIIDFGWVNDNNHVLVDYLLLDINIRGTTLPSQVSESDIFAIAELLDPDAAIIFSNSCLANRAQLIKEVIWKRMLSKGLIENWDREYVIPFLLMAYGLLVFLDAARNQPALIITVLTAANRIGIIQ